MVSGYDILELLLMCVFMWLQAQKFIIAYSAFLKRQGKLPIPGTSFFFFGICDMACQTDKKSWLTYIFLSGWVDTVKTSPAKELPPQSIDWYRFLSAPWFYWIDDLQGFILALLP